MSRSFRSHRLRRRARPSLIPGAISRIRRDFFGRDAHGVEGYFSGAWFTVDVAAQATRALRDYAAAELRVSAGEIMTLEDRHGGRLLVRAADGRRGWILESCAEAP